MAEESKQGEETREGEAASTLNRNFAGALGSILDAASEMFPTAGETDIRFSVALTGEMSKDKLPQLVDELPIVVDIALTKEVGTRAALLTDEPTALALASFVSGEEAPQEGAPGDDTLALLRDALDRIIDALSNACQDATGYPLGAIESIETVDTADPPPMMNELSTALSERLCRATASVTIGNEDNGRLVLVVPRDLVISLIRPRPKPVDATVSLHQPPRPIELAPGNSPLEHPPVVIGSGPAGLTAAELLARMGYEPILLERGPEVGQRSRDVRRFDTGGRRRHRHSAFEREKSAFHSG